MSDIDEGESETIAEFNAHTGVAVATVVSRGCTRCKVRVRTTNVPGVAMCSCTVSVNAIDLPKNWIAVPPELPWETWPGDPDPIPDAVRVLDTDDAPVPQHNHPDPTYCGSMCPVWQYGAARRLNRTTPPLELAPPIAALRGQLDATAILVGEISRLRNVIRTGGAMLAFERAMVGGKVHDETADRALVEEAEEIATRLQRMPKDGGVRVGDAAVIRNLIAAMVDRS